jgi:hypothetical protein
MYVKPSKNSPAAIRKAKWEAEAKARREAGYQLFLASVKPKG